MKVRKQHQIEISERSAALENLSNSVDKNRAWEDIKSCLLELCTVHSTLFYLIHFEDNSTVC